MIKFSIGPNVIKIRNDWTLKSIWEKETVRLWYNSYIKHYKYDVYFISQQSILMRYVKRADSFSDARNYNIICRRELSHNILVIWGAVSRICTNNCDRVRDVLILGIVYSDTFLISLSLWPLGYVFVYFAARLLCHPFPWRLVFLTRVVMRQYLPIYIYGILGRTRKKREDI